MGIKKIILVFTALLLSQQVAAADQQQVKNDSLQNSENSRVIIYLPKGKIKMSSLYYRLYVDGIYLGRLKMGHYHNLSLSPGKHRISANDRARTRMDITVGPAETIVVRTEFKRNFGLQLESVDPGYAIAEMPQLADLLQGVERNRIAQQ